MIDECALIINRRHLNVIIYTCCNYYRIQSHSFEISFGDKLASRNWGVLPIVFPILSSCEVLLLFTYIVKFHFVSQPVIHQAMLKARVKLIYYFGLFGIIGLHLNLLFNELEFPHPAKYIHCWYSHCMHRTGPPLLVRLHLKSHYLQRPLSENRHGLLLFLFQKGFR